MSPISERLLAELSAQGVGKEVLDKAASAPAAKPLTTRLVEAGAPPESVLRAASTAAGLPVAPSPKLRAPEPRAAAGTNAAACEKALAVPFGVEGGKLQIAFVDPERAQAYAQGKPNQLVYVSLEPLVRHAISALWKPIAAHPAPIDTSAMKVLTTRTETQAAPGAIPLSPSALTPAPAADALSPSTGNVPGAISLGAPLPLSPSALHARPAAPSAPSAPIALVQTEPAVAPALAATAPVSLTGTESTGPSPQATTAQHPLQASPPSRVSDYEVKKSIGQGGMATVFLARDLQGGRDVALKVMLPHLLNDPDAVQRFINEAKATVGLRHPNLVETLACGEEAGTYFIASEFVDGGTVEELLRKTGPMPADLALALFDELLAALEHAHAKGVVHRDLKPANLLLTRGGQLKVGDFGIAKTLQGAALTQTGMLIGTAAYMSPEQAQGGTVDQRSDLFTSGVILYELLNGKNPYDAENPAVALARVLAGPPPPLFDAQPSLRDALEPLLDKLLAHDAAHRFASAGEVRAALAPIRESLLPPEGLVARALAEPKGLVSDLRTAQVDRLISQAKHLEGGGAIERNQAALLAYRATLLLPDHAGAQEVFERLKTGQNLSFAPSTNPKIVELEAIVKKGDPQPGVYQQLGQLYRNEGNLFRAVSALKQYVKLRPKDGYAATQLSQLTGQKTGVHVAEPHARAPARASSLPTAPSAQSTQDLLAGVKTGGFAASPPTQRSTALNPASELDAPDLLPPSPSVAAQLWEGIGKKLIWPVVGLAVVALLVSSIGKFINKSVEETTRGADELESALKSAKKESEDKLTEEKIARAKEQAGEDAIGLISGARAALLAGRHDDAATIADQLVEKFPKRPQAQEALLIKGKAMLAAGRHSEVFAPLTRLLEDYPGSQHGTEALLTRGRAYYEQSDDAGAVADLTRLIEERKGSPFAPEAHLVRGQANLRRGMRADAAFDFRQALQSSAPSSALAVRAKDGLLAAGETP